MNPTSATRALQPSDRLRLTRLLAGHVTAIAADLRRQMLAEGPVRARAEQLHTDEGVGDDYAVWTDLLSRRAAVLWVLKSVYVRVLEDRGLLHPGRLFDPEAWQLFERLAPNLGETAFLRWVYRDLASPRGGLPELFGTQPAELAWPADELSRDLITFWRHRDADTGAAWSFAEEHFDGELMGDLYQELDPVVKDRFALCQTPAFVRAFILDRTLTPALDTFGADAVRLLDPACGSGHFLIDGLKRLVAATATQHPEWTRATVVSHALGRVVGIDLNDYACGLARARLVMTAAELAGVDTLAAASAFHPHIYWADGLEQVERVELSTPVQYSLFEKVEEKPRAVLSRSDVREALRAVFRTKFHAVVANPPYILERDELRKNYHRELIGKDRRYLSATGKYSLGSPFTERCFQLAEKGAFVGIITSNNFMKREFGKPLIETVLARVDLTLVVDTSQAYIPFHGTPTVLLFGRNRPPSTTTVRAVMGKRGEISTPPDPAQGKVWQGIEAGWGTVGFETEYVSVADLPRGTLGKHPWSLGGGGAADLKQHLEGRATARVGEVAEAIGITAVTGDDDVYVVPPSFAERRKIGNTIDLVIGEQVRNWTLTPAGRVVFPYDKSFRVLSEDDAISEIAYLRPYYPRTRHRRRFGTPMLERGLTPYELQELYPEKLRTPLSITFAFVATHNHFVLDRGGKVFNRTAPILKLPADATEDDHLVLLGLLNSSTACFWMKQVFHNKAGSGIGRGIQAEAWMERYEFDSTKMQLFPVLDTRPQTLPYATALDCLATERRAHDATAVLTAGTWTDAAGLRRALDARRVTDTAAFRRMVALQEELDWLNYALYGLDADSDVVAAEAVDPLDPVHLPWCLTLATKDTAIREALARGETPEELPTEWFHRHGWSPATALPDDLPPATRARITARQARTATTPALMLIENANFKRRWYRPDHAAEETAALQTWLADRVEQAARGRTRPFSLDQLVASLQDDPRALAVCEVLSGRRDFLLHQLVAEAVQGEAVPSHSSHLYKPTGLVKREVWERTWADQRREDAGEDVQPEVPPAYDSKDFLRPEHWRLRGKLDVPKERFIHFTEAPGPALYGWAGWTPIQRIRAILAVDEDLDDQGVSLADRTGLLDSAWRLLPDAEREDAAVAGRLRAELRATIGGDGFSREQLAAWKARFPPPGRGRARAADLAPSEP